MRESKADDQVAAPTRGKLEPPSESVLDLLAHTGEWSREDWLRALNADLSERWQQGNRLALETYLTQVPLLRDDTLAVLELIRNEVSLREQDGETPRLEEYASRFPGLEEPLSDFFATRVQATLTFAAGQAPPARSAPLSIPDPADTRAPQAALTPPLVGDHAGTLSEQDPFRTTTHLPKPPPASPPSPKEAEQFGPLPTRLKTVKVPGYEVLGILGRGGMGVVYKARHLQLKRLVALKMILGGEHAGPEHLARFQSEAEAVARLQHPNIVQVYEIGAHEGRPFFSLEFVDGGSLDRKIAGTPQTPRHAAQLVETLARAMHVAHQCGILHRDLKPANILLQIADCKSQIDKQDQVHSSQSAICNWQSAVPKITDFGLAKQLDDESGQTHSGAILGTPSYMAPEQASGKSKLLGPPCDVYALTAILYELLTGRPPFKGATAWETLDQVREQEPVPPSRLQPRVPRDLETICLKGLQKELSRRYSSALELAQDLYRFLHEEPILARPIGAWERGVKWTRRRPKDAALVAVGALALVAVIAGGLVYQGQRARAAEDKLRLRVDADQLVSQGEQARNRATTEEDWHQAKRSLDKALTLIGDDPSLADLRDRAETLRESVDHQLGERTGQRRASETHRQFLKLRDDALFHETLFTGLDPAANLQATRETARTALALVTRDSRKREGQAPALGLYYSTQQQSDIVDGYFELLLVLAEALAQPLPGSNEEGREQARQALEVLDRAARLEIATQTLPLRRARYLTSLNRGAEAQEAFAEARKLQPTGYLDFFLLGMDAYKNDAIPLAKKHFEEALRRQPNHYWTQNFLAICHLRDRAWERAEASLTACLSRRPNFVWLYLLRGYAYGELKAFDAAIADFDKARTLLVHEPDATAEYGVFVNRGVMWVRAGTAEDDPPRRRAKFEKAVADFQQAIALQPKQYQAYANLAQAYQGLTRLDEAAAQLDRAIALKPELAALYATRARIHLERQDRVAALRDFEQAIALEPPGSTALAHVDDHVHRGRLLHRDKKYAEAVRAYDSALRLRDDYALAHRWRAEALLDLRRFTEAAEAFDRYFRHAPRPQADVYRERGLVRARLGNLAGAIDDYARALELEPEFSAYSHRGWAYLLSDAPRLSLPDFEKSLQLNPENVDAYTGRGFARVKLGQYRAGVADAEKALSLTPTTPRTVYHAVRIYAQAAARLEGEQLSRPEQEQRYQYHQRALALLRQVFTLVPAEQRSSFWQDYIVADTALNPLHRTPVFAELATAYGRGKK